MMSGAVPPANWVVSWSLALSQLPCRISTWTSGLAEFQASTMACVAAIVLSWKAKLWNLSVIGSPLAWAPADVATPARAMPRAAAAPHALCFMYCSLLVRVGLVRVGLVRVGLVRVGLVRVCLGWVELVWVGRLGTWWSTGAPTARRRSSLHRPAEEAGGQAALDDGEEQQARD